LVSAGRNKCRIGTFGHYSALLDQFCASSLQTVENEEALGQVLQQMGVESGQNISFENFWNLINKQAVDVFKTLHKEKSIKCNCSLQ